MKTRATMLLAMLLTLPLASAARAATLNSPFVYTYGTDNLYCNVVNTGSAPASSVVVDLVDSSGTVIMSTSCNTVLPNHTCAVSSADAADARCRVTMSASPRKIRGIMEIDDSAGNTKVGLPLN